MSYYFAKTLELPFDAAVDKVVAQLKVQGFGVLTAINIRDTLEKKLGVEFPYYRKLAINNPKLLKVAAGVQAKLASVIERL